MTITEYNKCVDDFADSIYRFILKNTKNTDDAKDIVQETFEKLWIKLEMVTYGKVKSYLFTTAYHTLIDKIRKEKRQEGFDHVREENYTHDTQYSDLNEIINQAIDKLPEAQRSVILLRDYEGYSYAEIAEITGLNEAQVKVYIYRGRMFLKNYIGSMEQVI